MILNFESPLPARSRSVALTCHEIWCMEAVYWTDMSTVYTLNASMGFFWQRKSVEKMRWWVNGVLGARKVKSSMISAGSAYHRRDAGDRAPGKGLQLFVLLMKWMPGEQRRALDNFAKAIWSSELHDMEKFLSALHWRFECPLHSFRQSIRPNERNAEQRDSEGKGRLPKSKVNTSKEPYNAALIAIITSVIFPIMKTRDTCTRCSRQHGIKLKRIGAKKRRERKLFIGNLSWRAAQSVFTLTHQCHVGSSDQFSTFPTFSLLFLPLCSSILVDDEN